MDEFEKYYNKALKFLSYRPRSEKEIIDKLRLKKAPEDIVKKVIKKLKEYKFIDDIEFAKWWIKQRTTVSLKSSRIIKQELRFKGIDRDLIDDLGKKAADDLGIVKKIISKRIRRYEKLDQKEMRVKLMRYLASKGFSYDTIKRGIDDFFKKMV